MALLASGQALPAPVWLQPAGAAQHYVPRKPPDIRGLLFSPYGIMIGVRSAPCFEPAGQRCRARPCRRIWAGRRGTDTAGFDGGAARL